MADKKAKVEETKEAKIVSKISSFITANRKLILIVLSAIVVALVVVIIATQVVTNKNEKTFIRVADYEAQLSDIIASEDTTVVSNYISSVEKEIKGKSYSSVKAAYILGEYYANKEEWSKAYDYFIKAHDLNSKMYLADVALFNAAVASDELEKTSQALDLYRQIADKSDFALAPKALFNVARIYMQQGNTELAKATFQQLIDTYPNSEYSSVSKNIVSVM